MDLAFVTSNPGKIREARAILAPMGIRVRPVRRTLPEPQAERLETVVAAKLAALRPSRRPQLVEDSGLFLPALGGFPGVYSAYVYDLWGRGRSFAPIFDLLRKRSRVAVFRTVAGVRIGRRDHLFVGECRGRIAPRPAGANGFGFDPIFIPAGYHQTFGQLDPDVKLRISHRGRAIRAAGRFLAAK